MSRYLSDGEAHTILERLRRQRGATDASFSRQELDRQRREEEQDRRFRHRVLRRREFERQIGLNPEELSADELRAAWEWANGVASRGNS